jgi:hypothetical protein
MASIGEKPDDLTPIDRDDRDASLVGVFNTNLANFTIDRRNTPVYCKNCSGRFYRVVFTLL